MLTINNIPVKEVLADFKPRIYPTCIVKGQLLTGMALIKKSQHTTSSILQYNNQLGMYKQMTVEVGDKQYLIYYDPNHQQTAERLKKDVDKYQEAVIQHHELSSDVKIPAWCRENRHGKFVMERGKAWSKYLAHTNYVFSLSRPFATTVHKAPRQ